MSNPSHSFHTPVLLDESLSALNIKPDGIYVDVTYGGGGHSRPILDRLNAKGHLYAFDQDEAAKANALSDPRFTFVQGNFTYLEHFMRYYKEGHVDGILADLGVSSHHFDEGSRGFSYRFESLLDMRMNQSAQRTARDVIAHSSVERLVEIFSKYGELRNAKTFAGELVKTRRVKEIKTIRDLLDIINRVYRGDLQKYTSQVFQALRIEVNDEFGVLENFLEAALRMLKSGGRLVVISYHSLEDKIVKRHFLKSAKVFDEYGRESGVIKRITQKPLLPGKEEIIINSRAASAKLRVVEKI